MNFNEQLKVKIRERSLEQSKHLVVKSLIPFLLSIKYKNILRYQEIYTEFPISEGKICDVFHLNNKSKEINAYEIQGVITKDWIEKTTKAYKTFQNPYFKLDWHIIKLKELPDDINQLTKTLNCLII